jgi:hypothetical protein
MDYVKILMSLPSSLLSNRRVPNISGGFTNPFDIKKNLMNKKTMSDHPLHVLPNGNVVLSNGNIVNGKAIFSHGNVSDVNASPVKRVAEDKVLMSNGNIIDVNHQKKASLPVGVIDKHVIMSNGNLISPEVLKLVPQEMPNKINTSPSENSEFRVHVEFSKEKPLNKKEMMPVPQLQQQQPMQMPQQQPMQMPQQQPMQMPQQQPVQVPQQQPMQIPQQQPMQQQPMMQMPQQRQPLRMQHMLPRSMPRSIPLQEHLTIRPRFPKKVVVPRSPSPPPPPKKEHLRLLESHPSLRQNGSWVFVPQKEKLELPHPSLLPPHPLQKEKLELPHPSLLPPHPLEKLELQHPQKEKFDLLHPKEKLELQHLQKEKLELPQAHPESFEYLGPKKEHLKDPHALRKVIKEKMGPVEGFNGNNGQLNSVLSTEDECPIAPPSRPLRYCRPAPFHSTAGEKYFYVGEAYGAPVAE